MARNPRIFVLGEGIGKRGGNFSTTAGLFEQYGAERLCDTPICERGFVGLACGAAMTGTRPVIDFMFADFVLDAVGEIVNQIAKMQYMSSGRLKMPVLLRGCIGIGHSAATHHSGNLLSDLRPLPGPARRRAVDAVRRQGPVHARLALGRPRAVSRTSRVAGHQGAGARGAVRDRVRPGRVVRAGTDVDRRGPGASWCTERSQRPRSWRKRESRSR